MTLPYDEVPAPVAAYWALKDKARAENCADCDTPLWVEGRIDDSIDLCHPCYEATHTRPESIDSKLWELHDIVLTLRSENHPRTLDLHAVFCDLKEAIDELRERN